MPIYFNPHVDDFLAEPLQFRILKRRALKKYGFMFDEARKDGISIRVLIDGTASGIIPEPLFHYLPRWLRLVVASLEFKLWKKINGFGDEIEQVTIPAAPVDDVLIAFSYKAATGRFHLRESTLMHYRAVVFHLSHYFVATKEKADNIRRMPNAYLAGDSDITENSYFQIFFSWYSKPFLILHFAVGDRFVNKKSWLKRDNKAVATGSFHNLSLEKPTRKYIDFMTATGATTYHPVRLSIHQSAEQLANLVTCKVSPYRQYGKNYLSRLFSYFQVTQKKYFSINIVDLYNQHRYAIVGEEVSGFPALGAFEAMACGCILIAQSEYYKRLGLIPNVHYIPFDGRIDSISEIFNKSNYQSLTNISSNGVDLILHKFKQEAVYKKWINTLNELR